MMDERSYRYHFGASMLGTARSHSPSHTSCSGCFVELRSLASWQLCCNSQGHRSNHDCTFRSFRLSKAPLFPVQDAVWGCDVVLPPFQAQRVHDGPLLNLRWRCPAARPVLCHTRAKHANDGFRLCKVNLWWHAVESMRFGYSAIRLSILRAFDASYFLRVTNWR
jgi:hypothetical protein